MQSRGEGIPGAFVQQAPARTLSSSLGGLDESKPKSPRQWPSLGLHGVPSPLVPSGKPFFSALPWKPATGTRPSVFAVNSSKSVARRSGGQPSARRAIPGKGGGLKTEPASLEVLGRPPFQTSPGAGGRWRLAWWGGVGRKPVRDNATPGFRLDQYRPLSVASPSLPAPPIHPHAPPQPFPRPRLGKQALKHHHWRKHPKLSGPETKVTGTVSGRGRGWEVGTAGQSLHLKRRGGPWMTLNLGTFPGKSLGLLGVRGPQTFFSPHRLLAPNFLQMVSETVKNFFF